MPAAGERITGFEIDISVVLVTYNTRDLTLKAIEAIQADAGSRSLEIWVVDNASSDGTVEEIRKVFSRVHLIINSENKGFGAANNQGMSAASGKYLLLINTDAFVHAGAINSMLERAESDAAIGVVGPRLLNSDGSVQQSCFAFPSPTHSWLENLWLTKLIRDHSKIGSYRNWNHDTAENVDWVSGACMLVRKAVFDSLGGFDEQFFMYSEETDWQWRMRQHGVQIAFEPKAVVTHLGGGSGESVSSSIIKNRNFFESLDYYELKHHGWSGLISVRLAMAIGCSLRAAIWFFAWLVQPRRRAAAMGKLRLHIWLTVRQLTNWPFKLLMTSRSLGSAA